MPYHQVIDVPRDRAHERAEHDVVVHDAGSTMPLPTVAATWS